MSATLSERLRRCACVGTFATLSATPTLMSQSPAPQAEKRPVTDEYAGEKLTDDYRWLESASEAGVKAWTDAQNARTQAYFEGLPVRQRLVDQFRREQLGKTVGYRDLQIVGPYAYAARLEPPRPQPRVVRRRLAAESGAEETVFDPGVYDPSGHTSFDWYAPSPDGTLLALSLSKNGSEAGDLYLLDATTGDRRDEIIPGVQFGTAGGSAALDADGRGVYYTRYPRPGERESADLPFFQQVYHHRLGTPASEDVYEIGKDFPKIAEIKLDRSPSGRWTLASVANGDGGQFAHYLRGGDGTWRQLTKFEDGIKEAVFGGDDRLYLLSVKGAPRGEVLVLALGGADADREFAPRPFVPEAEDSAIEGIAATADALLVNDVVGGPTRVRVFRRDGQPDGVVAIPPLDAVTGMASDGLGQVLLDVSSYTEPVKHLLWETSGTTVRPTAFQTESGVSFGDIEERRAFATSPDGTKVPISVLLPKGSRLNGALPTILYGYGGYGLNSSPRFDPFLRGWFDLGGVFAVANIRGGGEYGEPWHQAGMLEHKQNTLDDFAAAARWLTDEKYTDAAHLGVWGISNGGITAGGFLTQHPEEARAVVIQVGVLDVIRSEAEPNGEFNTTEYGTVKNPAQYQAIRAYSPYQNVRDGVRYPAVFFTAGENDHRVASWHAKKMTARLQAASASGYPILLETSATAGHGFGTAFDERLRQEADVYAFFDDQLKGGKDDPGLKR